MKGIFRYSKQGHQSERVIFGIRYEKQNCLPHVLCLCKEIQIISIFVSVDGTASVSNVMFELCTQSMINITMLNPTPGIQNAKNSTANRYIHLALIKV